MGQGHVGTRRRNKCLGAVCQDSTLLTRMAQSTVTLGWWQQKKSAVGQCKTTSACVKMAALHTTDVLPGTGREGMHIKEHSPGAVGRSFPSRGILDRMA